jgi:transcriptional regulator with XRE-family HTH domain
MNIELSEQTEHTSQRELAKALGVAPSQITRYKKLGAPIDKGIEAIEAWRQDNLANQSKLTSIDIEDTHIPDPIPVDGDCVYDVLERCRSNEQIISGEIRSLTLAINRARSARNSSLDEGESKLLDKKVYSYSQMLKVLRKEHREATRSLLSAESAVVALEEQRGKLVIVEAARDMVTKMLMPIILFFRKLPEFADDETQVAKLAEIGEHGLAIIRGEAE